MVYICHAFDIKLISTLCFAQNSKIRSGIARGYKLISSSFYCELFNREISSLFKRTMISHKKTFCLYRMGSAVRNKYFKVSHSDYWKNKEISLSLANIVICMEQKN